MYYCVTYKSPIGPLLLVSKEDKLIGLWMYNQKYFCPLKEHPVEDNENTVLKTAVSWLDEYFRGNKPDISLLPLLSKTLGVSVDELLSGKQESAPAVQIVPANERKDIKDMVLRIVVSSAENDNVRVNIPLSLVKVGVDTGLNMAQITSGNEALKNIDLGKILELVEQGVIGNLVEVESAKGDTVRIFVE